MTVKEWSEIHKNFHRHSVRNSEHGAQTLLRAMWPLYASKEKENTCFPHHCCYISFLELPRTKVPWTVWIKMVLVYPYPYLEAACNIVRYLVHAFLVSLTYNYITPVFDFSLYSVLPLCLFSYNLCFPNKDASLVGLMAILYYSSYDTAICTLAYFPGMSY